MHSVNWSLLVLGMAVTALSTSFGSLPALAMRYISDRANNICMGFSAGIMLSASSFSLINPAISLGVAQTGNKMLGAGFVGLALLAGAGFLLFCNRMVPHEHFVSGPEGGTASTRLKRIWLFVFAIALHNFPEGLAVGSGLGSQNTGLALPIITGIGLQDLPEGFVVAAALMSVGYSRAQSILVAVLTGVLEAMAAAAGTIATSQVEWLLPWALAFAGGAMIYVVVEEMIPEIQGKGPAGQASTALVFGFVLMMFLDVALTV